MYNANYATNNINAKHTRIVLLLTAVLTASCATTDTAVEKPSADDSALADQFEELAQHARYTPGRESTLHAATVPHKAKYLRGEKPATRKQLADARAYYKRRIAEAQRGLAWPKLPAIQIPRATEAINCDGIINEPAWQQAVVFEGVYQFNDPKYLNEPRTTWRMLWDDKYLYIAYECQDNDIVAPTMKRDGPVYSHDCIEAFIMPSIHTAVYWEIIVSPSGSIFDGLHAKQLNLWGFANRADRDMQGLQVGINVDGTIDDSSDQDKQYTIELAVPFDQLPEYSRASPKAGQQIWLMLVRLNQTGQARKNYAFQPLMSWGHNIWNHVRCTLVERAGSTP